MPWRTLCLDLLLTSQSQMNAGHPSAPVAVLLLTWVFNHGIAMCKAATPAGHQDHMYKYRLCSPSRRCRRPYVRWWVLEIFPPLQQKNFVSSCSGNVFFFFFKQKFIIQNSQRKNCCQGSQLSLSGGPWDTWHTLKNVQCQPPPCPFLCLELDISNFH